MRIERILTREYWNSPKSYLTGEVSSFISSPIIKLKPTNIFKLTFTGIWSSIAYNSPGYFHPIMLLGLRNIASVNTKTTSQISGEPVNNDFYFGSVGTRRTVHETGQHEANNFYCDQVEPFTLILDEYPTSFESFALFLKGAVGTGYASTQFGFTINIQELTYDTPIWYQPNVKQIYTQVFNGDVATANYLPYTEFYFNRYIKKSNKNRWLCSLINQSINSISAGIRQTITHLRLNIPETNAVMIFNKNPEFYPVVIDMTLSANPGGTNDNIIVKWLYNDGQYSDWEIVATAPPASSDVDVTFFPQNIPDNTGDNMVNIVGMKLSCSGIDGYHIASISINNIASTNTGWIDTDNPTYPSFRDYEVVITNANIADFENSINGGMWAGRMTNNWGLEATQYVPNQWIMNELNGQPFNVVSARISALGNFNTSTAKPMTFTIQFEEIEDEDE